MGNLHVIIGEDDFLVGETAKRIAGDASGTALEVIDSANDSNAADQMASIKKAMESFRAPPFLDPVKVTWWKNVGFLPQSGKGGPGEEVKGALERLAENLASSPMPENQKFIISGPRMLKTSIFAKTLAKVAEIVFFAAAKPWEQQRDATVRAIDLAKELGLAFGNGVAEKFIAVVGTDTRSIMSELGKMRDYLGDGRKTISAEDVSEISSQGVGVEPAIWDVTDAIGERNAGKAIAAARRFEGENGFAVFMSGVIEKFFRQLAELKDAQEQGLWAEATEGMAPFAARKNEGFLRKWRLVELRLARARFVALREKAVSSAGSIDAQVIAEIARSCA